MACAPAAPPEPPAPPAPSGPALSPLPPEDPRVLRCGVDDRPIPLGLGERAPGPLSPAERTVLGERAVDVAPVEEPPQNQVSIRLGPPRLASGPMPSSLTTGLTGAATPDTCADLAEPSDSGHLDLQVTLASTAQPLTVRAGDKVPSKFARCVMERACQLRASTEAALATLVLPLDVQVEPPAPPTPPPPEPVRLQPQITLVRPGPAEKPFQDEIEATLRSVFSVCETGAEEPTKTPLQLRLTLERRAVGRLDDLAPAPLAPADRSVFGLMRRPRHDELIVTSAQAITPPPPALKELVACVLQQLDGHGIVSLPDRSKRSSITKLVIKVSLVP